MAQRKYKAILADLDGTINRGNDLIDGASRIYRSLREQGVRWIFISNSARKLAGDLTEKINRLGLPVSQDQVINSATALLEEIERGYAGATAFVIGEPPLIAGIEATGMRVQLDGGAADIVIVAMDADFHYTKLNAAFQCLQRGALFWATNLDPTFPAERGFVPGAGALVAAVAAAIGRQPDRVFGKPQKDMALLALRRLDLSPRECLVVGDRMDTDVMFARNAGIDSALVLTGATSLEQLSKYDFKPDYIFDDITGVQELFGEVAT